MRSNHMSRVAKSAQKPQQTEQRGKQKKRDQVIEGITSIHLVVGHLLQVLIKLCLGLEEETKLVGVLPHVLHNLLPNLFVYALGAFVRLSYQPVATMTWLCRQPAHDISYSLAR